MLDPHFIRRLERDTRAIWASKIDDDQLAGLIWALGDLSRRIGVLIERLDEHRAEIDPTDSDFARARLLLQRLSDLVNAGSLCAPPWPPGRGEIWRPIVDSLGPQRFWARRTSPIFTGEFRQRLEYSKGKYFAWAQDLTEDHLFAILATIGELAPHIHRIAAQLDRHQPEIWVPVVAYARARTVLDLIAEMVGGTRLAFDDVSGRIYWSIRKAQKR